MTDGNQESKPLRRKSILELTHGEARDFLLKPESYFNSDLPPYIVFGEVISAAHQTLQDKDLKDYRKNHPSGLESVNYTILHNKDGKYSWRPYELIHPALYVSLIHKITEEDHWQLINECFRKFSSNGRLNCMSLPMESTSKQSDKAEQITHWWEEIEQRSISLSLDYEYLIQTDITDCYGAIYTHSIAWALHTKAEAKRKRKALDLIGNLIDSKIQAMRNGQTNGIPQGSVLMDFIAEMVLGFADQDLSERIQKAGITEDYHILRYRDDYRIFVNNPQTGEHIVKLIVETTSDLGLKLNAVKTKASNDVVRASIKSDKLAWMTQKHDDRRYQKYLLIINEHAVDYPNSGSLHRALNDFYKRILRTKKLSENPMPLIAIVVNIAYRNPRAYSVCAAILSKLLNFVETYGERLEIIERIRQKFSKIPNTGHMQIWLQRVTYPLDPSISYDEPICQLVAGSSSRLWNNDWIRSNELLVAIDAAKIVDKAILNDLAPVIPLQEIETFLSKSFYG